MKVGVTASRTKPNAFQISTFDQIMNAHTVTELHHGDCVGGDEAAHYAAVKAYVPLIVVHPPIDPKLRARVEGGGPGQVLICGLGSTQVIWRDPKPFLDRNKDVVDETEALIAMPDGPEKLRSGTWSTVRYARKLGRPIYVIGPTEAGWER